MRKRELLTLFVGAQLLISSCGEKSENTASTKNETISEAVVEEVAEEIEEPKACNLESFSFKLGEMGRTMKFSYEGDKVTSVETITMGQNESQSMTYSYDENGRLSSFEMQGSKATYAYDKDGKLTEITGEGSINTRTMEYDENGNIIKQVTMFGGKPFTTHEYSYEGNIPVKVTIYDKKGEATEETSLKFDDKPNAFIDKGAFANSTEMMFGYPVGNYVNNLVGMNKTYLKKTSYQIDGEYKNPGDTESKEKNYQYDENGYIVKDITTRGDKEIVTEFTYSCE